MEMFDSLNGMKKSEEFEDMKFVEKVFPDPNPGNRGNNFKRTNSEATEDKTQMLKEMVVSYMKIVHKTVLDITPKYIIMALVQEVTFLVAVFKGGLISESFSLWLKCPEHLFFMRIVLRIVFGTLFGRSKTF